MKQKLDITLLVVDDERLMRSMLTEFLREVEGYTVCTASDGYDALENVLPHQKVDLILSDINMPGMNGFELLQKVKSDYKSINSFSKLRKSSRHPWTITLHFSSWLYFPRTKN
jgi:CheY-like chemotaxis protein